MTHIGANAFLGAKVTRVVLAQGLHCIRSKTFGNCTKLLEIVIPPSVQAIDSDAFEGCSDALVVFCEEGSYAHTFAVANGMEPRLITSFA